MPWKVYCDKMMIPHADRIDLHARGMVTVYSNAEKIVSPLRVEHVTAIWEKPSARKR